MVTRRCDKNDIFPIKSGKREYNVKSVWDLLQTLERQMLRGTEVS